MTTFDDREKSYEQKFAHESEIEFKIHAKARKLLGLWAATHLKLTEEAAHTYATEVMSLDLDTRHTEKIVQKLIADLQEKGLTFTSVQIYDELERLYPIAKQVILQN